MKTSTRSLGQEAETLAAQYLWQEGYEILHQNFYTRLGELDLVVTRANFIVFVEVKSLSERYSEDFYATINAKKLRRLYKSAEVWLKLHGHKLPKRLLQRLDYVGILKTEQEFRLKHLQGIGLF